MTGHWPWRVCSRKTLKDLRTRCPLQSPAGSVLDGRAWEASLSIPPSQGRSLLGTFLPPAAEMEGDRKQGLLNSRSPSSGSQLGVMSLTMRFFQLNRGIQLDDGGCCGQHSTASPGPPAPEMRAPRSKCTPANVFHQWPKVNAI